MRGAKSTYAVSISVALVVFLGACSNPGGGNPAPTWSKVTSFDQIVGTWSGSATVEIPADADAGMPAYSQSVDYVIVLDATNYRTEYDVDMTNLITTYNAQAQTLGAGAALWARMSLRAGTQVHDDGGTTVTTFSAGAPNIMNVTHTGTLDPDFFISADEDEAIEKSSDGTQLKFPVDPKTTGLWTMILVKQ